MMTSKEKTVRRPLLRVGVIGFGYWGPNIVRNFSAVDGCEVTMICDKNQSTLVKAGKSLANVVAVGDVRDVIGSPEVDIVAVVTPVSTHFELAKQALLAGKHVFVEKPFTATVEQALELNDIAERKGLRIMVDHTFIFTGAVRKIKEIVDQGMLGDIYYYDSTRINLGLLQHDASVVWDLAPHDFSIMLHLMNERPAAVSASGKSHVNGMVDVAYVTVYFANSIIAHFNVNWLSPVKVRNTLIGGGKKMLVWNDVIADDKIKVYDKGVEVGGSEGLYTMLVSYRSGDMWAPRLDQKEALALECEHFINSIIDGTPSLNDGQTGLEVVRLLEACDKSMAAGGKQIDVDR